MKSCNDCIRRSLSCMREHHPDFAEHCSDYLDTNRRLVSHCKICGKECTYVEDSYVICNECIHRLRKLLYPEEGN